LQNEKLNAENAMNAKKNIKRERTKI